MNKSKILSKMSIFVQNYTFKNKIYQFKVLINFLETLFDLYISNLHYIHNIKYE